MSLGNPVYCVRCKRELSLSDEYCVACGQPQRPGLPPRVQEPAPAVQVAATAVLTPVASSPLATEQFARAQNANPNARTNGMAAGVLAVIVASIGITARVLLTSYRYDRVRQHETEAQQSIDPGMPQLGAAAREQQMQQTQQELANRSQMRAYPNTSFQPGTAMPPGFQGNGLPMNPANRQPGVRNPYNDPNYLAGRIHSQHNNLGMPPGVPGSVPPSSGVNGQTPATGSEQPPATAPGMPSNAALPPAPNMPAAPNQSAGGTETTTAQPGTPSQPGGASADEPLPR